MNASSSSCCGSTRPDTFFDDPSTTDDDLGDIPSSAFASSPPLTRQLSISRTVAQLPVPYVGPDASPLALHNREYARLALSQGTPGFFGLTSTTNGSETKLPPADVHGAQDDTSSYDASAEELSVTGHARPISITASGSPRVVHNSSPRSSIFDSRRNSKVDTLFGVNMMNAPTLTQQPSENNQLVEDHDKNHPQQCSDDEKTASHAQQSAPSAPARRFVQVFPPPIDTIYHGSLPDDIVRTPYPFKHEKELRSESPVTALPPLPHSILTLWLWGQGGRRGPKASHIAVPAPLEDYSQGVVSGGRFDDEYLFRQLRSEHRRLRGRWRFFSARTLQRIIIRRPWTLTTSESHSQEERQFYNGSDHHSRSPRLLRSHDVATSSMEAALWAAYQRPARENQGRYNWTRWAYHTSRPVESLGRPNTIQKTALSPGKKGTSDRSRSENESASGRSSDDVGLGLNRRQSHSQHIAGLEFIQGWSGARIALGLASVVFLALAGVLLWTFVGVSDASDVGLHNAASRLGTALVLGGFVLVVGWTCLFGWFVMSWLVD